MSRAVCDVRQISCWIVTASTHVCHKTNRTMARPMHHYEASLERDLARLHSKLREMAARNDQSLRDGLKALMTNDRQLAYSIILRDTFIDALDREIDRLCLEFIIRQQPVGFHLRFAAAV